MRGPLLKEDSTTIQEVIGKETELRRESSEK
jgi:hypothetical protein